MQVGCATVTACALSSVMRVWVMLEVEGVGRTGGMQPRVFEVAACVEGMCSLQVCPHFICCMFPDVCMRALLYRCL